MTETRWYCLENWKFLKLSSFVVVFLALNNSPIDAHGTHNEEIAKSTIVHRTSGVLKNSITHFDWNNTNGAINYLLADSTDLRLNTSNLIDATILQILKDDGPDMRPSRDFKDSPLLTVEVSRRAWTLLHEHAVKAARDKVKSSRVAIMEILESSRVTDRCISSVSNLLDGVERLESWAIKITNSWGDFPPVGLFDGTYSQVGSYDSCVDSNENRFIGHAHYCSLTFKPLLARRKDYDLVFNREPLSFRQLFKKYKGSSQVTEAETNIFADLMEHAQYNHYVYYKIGSCWPIGCSPYDIKKVVKLIGRRNILINGPVKCYSRFEQDYEDSSDIGNNHENSSLSNKFSSKDLKLKISVWDKNDGIFVWKPFFNKTQKVALIIISMVTIIILSMTLVDIILNRVPNMLKSINFALKGDSKTGSPAIINGNISHTLDDRCTEMRIVSESTINSLNIGVNPNPTKQDNNPERKHTIRPFKTQSAIMRFIDDCSIITNWLQFFSVSEGQLRNDILCLNGIRCLTMLWILMTHTMLYNDWSAFGRTRLIEGSIKSAVTQPFFNGSYLVDSFFLMSGLLSAYTSFKHSQGQFRRFNSIVFIVGRWLRLTPQIFFISMIYIILPSLSSGPHWWPIVGEYSENCVDNWWINILHLQSFYRTDRMCNFVTWWISIDYLYHYIAIPMIWTLLLAGHKVGLGVIISFVGSQVIWQIFRHYQLSLPPNIFSTIPQTGAMWSTMTLNFFWTPYTHAVPFFFGFYLGYLMALKKELITSWLNTRRALIGWIVSVSLLIFQSYASYWWVVGKLEYSRAIATVHYSVCPIIWTSAICWIIIACHHGYGGFINKFLSLKIFIIMGKASYFIYLSHFQILFLFFGNTRLLLEPTPLYMYYAILGNTFLSTLYGVFLCIVFELPWLKQQRILIKYI